MDCDLIGIPKYSKQMTRAESTITGDIDLEPKIKHYHEQVMFSSSFY